MKVNPGRRQVLLKASGMAAIGVVGGCATATGINPAVPPAAKLLQDPKQTGSTAVGPGSVPPGPSPQVKPTYVARASEPADYSLADNLFWNDIMMEHAI